MLNKMTECIFNALAFLLSLVKILTKGYSKKNVIFNFDEVWTLF